MSQQGPTWDQLEANTNLKIIEKPLFFPGFFHILRNSLEAFGIALGDSLGMPWGAPGDASESLGRPGERLGDALGGLGGPWERLARPWERLGGPWERLGRPF